MNKFTVRHKLFVTALILFGLCFFAPRTLRAATLKTDYPRLANYFLKWEISDAEARDLAKWDLLVLDMEVQTNSRAQLLKIRELNPDIVILAYVNSVEQVDNANDYNYADMRQQLASQINSTWWLKDASGRKISYWPNNSMLNLTDLAPVDNSGRRFNDYLPSFVVSELKASGLWDGVYYDNTWGDISWLNSGNIDTNNDGVRDQGASADAAWAAGFKKVLVKTRELAGNDFIIVGNGRVYAGYQGLLNGSMLESFPSDWENGGTWTGSMKSYLNLPAQNLSPNFSILNVSDKDKSDYQHLRFGLTSALMGNGFFSFDYDVSNHGQTWWYDEYEVSLGSPQSAAYNLLANRSTNLQPGLWRRDFKNATAIVNSTAKEQLFVFSKEEMEKIKGLQDPAFNNGDKISYLKLAPSDGIILLRHNVAITDSAFTNGFFYRIYNFQGEQARNGFFSYLNSFPGEQEVIVAKQELTTQDLNLSAGFGRVDLQKDGTKLASFFPYTKNYTGRLNLAASLSNGSFQQIITGPTSGGPQVLIFQANGKLAGNFFAYDKNSRTGVNVAIGDVNSDGQNEIVTGPGAGLEPLVKIFSLRGVLLNSFLAYGKSFKGGVGVAIGDVNGDGQNEIITGPGAGGGPQVRVFNYAGQALKSFFAYDASYHGGIKVGASDINDDGQAEILVGIKNFY
ncbi:MAG: putative glycoside hydrolase [Patescibacteria group bacterium]